MKVVPGAAGFAATAAGRPADAALALAIGNFDGVHLGHAALLAEARARAARRGGQSAVLTFTPHPARLFAPERAPLLIMSLERRLELCAEAGIDVAIVQPFTRDFAAIDAAAFVRQVLAEQLGARDAVVGYDFSFGRGRAGNAAMLGALGADAGIDVAVIPPVAIDGVPCSSTRIRELVAAGDATAAAKLLGRPFELEAGGARAPGAGAGLGFPTAKRRPRGRAAPEARDLRGARAGPGRSAGGHGARGRPQRRHESPVCRRGRDGRSVLLDFEAISTIGGCAIEVGELLRDERRFESIDA
jgi:riboflavin kinase/FMN adenylyltransferase